MSVLIHCEKCENMHNFSIYQFPIKLKTQLFYFNGSLIIKCLETALTLSFAILHLFLGWSVFRTHFSFTTDTLKM